MKKNAVQKTDDSEFKKKKHGMPRKTIELITGHREVKNLKHAWLEHANDYETVEEFYQ